jgi:peroxiredoxin Q/BCP
MGRVFLGIKRDTYLINPTGQIVKEYKGVDPKKHATEIIADLQKLQSASA